MSKIEEKNKKSTVNVNEKTKKRNASGTNDARCTASCLIACDEVATMSQTPPALFERVRKLTFPQCRQATSLLTMKKRSSSPTKRRRLTITRLATIFSTPKVHLMTKTPRMTCSLAPVRT